MKKLIILFVSTLVAGSSFAQVTPAPPQDQPVAIIGGTAHLGNGEIIQSSIITFENGKITAVADASVVRVDRTTHKIIDATGKHVYPGFIAPNTTLGLVEVSAVRATRDYSEVGALNPNVRSVIAYNTDSKIIPTVRSNGILLAQATPRGGLISGSSSVMELDGWNWEDAVHATDDGIHLNWPKMFVRSGWWGEPGPIKPNKKREEHLQQLEQLFAEASTYRSISGKEDANLKLEAMQGLFNGSKRLYINADHAKEIVEAVSFAKKHNIKNPVIVGGKDAWMVTDVLKENNVPVILDRIHALPMRTSDNIKLPYQLPHLLKEAGVLFCLGYEGDMEAMGLRNLPFIAGTATTYGLAYEDAVAAITGNTAKILGIDGQVGTLEIGKDATLIISSGDALDMRTNNIEHAFIQGKEIDLNDKQKELYRKYKTKYEASETK